MRVAWLLNFDADEELERPRAYAPRAAVLERARELVPRCRLLREGDVLVEPGVRLAERLVGRAFCPTPRALALLSAAGAVAPPAPPLDVLRRVNDRTWCAALGRTLRESRVATKFEDVAAALADRPPASNWVIKRAFGFAGRGHRRVRPPELAASRTWIEAALRAGGAVIVEPWVDRVADFGLHGHVSPSGDVVLGEPTVQCIDARGAWIDTERASASDLSDEERGELFDAAHETAAALHEAGYFGPFGIDAFRYRTADGAFSFLPRCEVNARYSMGWAVGMGERRPDLSSCLRGAPPSAPRLRGRPAR